MKTLRLILGDQLNYNHSWFKNKSDSVVYVMMEIRQETDYVKHHIQKIVGFFAAMREFANHLENKGHKLVYLKINDPDNQQTISDNIKTLISKHNIDTFEYQMPDEYRLDKILSNIVCSLDVNSRSVDTEHFYTTRYEVRDFFHGKKSYVLESFYRYMRKKHDILMEGENPVGGKWNFDAKNRKKWTSKENPPPPKIFKNDCSGIYEEIKKAEIDYFGRIEPDKYIYPINKEQTESLLNHFCVDLLPNFGTYQDAMLNDSWSLFHSRLSFAMNIKLISPKEVIERAIEEWERRSSSIAMNQIEGFVRQILGWREYMRGVYWAYMPDYENLNFFDHERKLPEYFWTGETKMNCVSKAVNNSLDNAYAHHIQRLMVTGAFSLMAGINPDEVDAWYLGVYADAIQWVEITNTRGMSQFADGGIVGTKPYLGTANYINKMSDYCSTCTYDKTKKYGDNACPLNSLYWNFYHVNRDKLSKNPRVGFVYPTLNKMDKDELQKILDQADYYLKNIEEL